MPTSRPSVPPAPASPSPSGGPSPFVERLLLLLACAAAFGLYALLGRSLLPPRVRADATAGLLPALVIAVASVSVLQGFRRSWLLAFGATAGFLALYVGLMRLLF